MNKLIKGLLVTALAVSTSVANASTNMTFLMPRPHGVNLALERTAGFNELIHHKMSDDFGGKFQAAFFWMDSTDEDDIGKYFGIKDKHEFMLDQKDTQGSLVSTAEYVDLGYLIHDKSITSDTDEIATLKLSPDHTAYGVYFNYHQDLDKILKGLFFKVNVPVVHVENEMHLTAKSDTTTIKENLEKYFKGTLNVPYATSKSNAQEALTKAKMIGQDSETGVADIDIMLGYRFLDKAKYHGEINFGFTIPTGTEAKADYVFEAIVGNGKHWAIGGGLDFGARVWGDKDHNVKLAAAFNYRYLFENDEVRTPGIKDRNWGQYFLLGKKDNDDKPLTPAANVITKHVDVKPGNQFDGIIAL